MRHFGTNSLECAWVLQNRILLDHLNLGEMSSLGDLKEIRLCRELPTEALNPKA